MNFFSDAQNSKTEFLSNLTHIWLKVKRMHIGPTGCHFLLSTVRITEGPKNEIMRKTGIHSSVTRRRRASTLQGVRKKSKKGYLLEPQLEHDKSIKTTLGQWS